MASIWRRRPPPDEPPVSHPAAGGSPLEIGLDYVEVAERLEDAVLLAGVDREVRWLNRSARQIFDIPGQPLGRPLLEVVRDHRIDALAARVAESGEEARTELEMPVSGRSLLVRAAPLASGRAVCIIARDLTRLRHLETVRQQFVANLSHELRTPLAGLDLAAQTLSGQLPAGGEQRLFMDRILQESQRLAAILLNLTQLAALDAEQMTVEKNPFAIDALLGQLVERFQARAMAAGLGLRAEVPEGIQAFGDRAKTDQALQNIVDNALKFTTTGEVVLSAVADAEWVEIAVVDTGAGIPPQDLSRIFERFYKVDRARGRQVPGSGLGLSIARHLVELQGGRLVAESRPGLGTTLRLILPRYR